MAEKEGESVVALLVVDGGGRNTAEHAGAVRRQRAHPADVHAAPQFGLDRGSDGGGRPIVHLDVVQQRRGGHGDSTARCFRRVAACWADPSCSNTRFFRRV